MAIVKMLRQELGRTEAFLSYDTLSEVNSIDPQRQFKYAEERYYVPSATWHNRGLMLGIGASAKPICDELRSRGYIGLIEIETINPRLGINQIRGRPVVPS
ncbi:MAG: hypothetical protein Q8N99_04515 [Nanoarchaeota archaeon]|nr:hypothetical protein [Nanoarchaeota archaeon]